MFTTSHTHADYPECYLLPAAAPCCCCPRRSASFDGAVVGPQSPSAATAATTPCRCRRSSYCMQYTRIDPRACLETCLLRAALHARRAPAPASAAFASATPSPRRPLTSHCHPRVRMHLCSPASASPRCTARSPRRPLARSHRSLRVSVAPPCVPPPSPASVAADTSVAAAGCVGGSAQACLQTSTLKSPARICARRVSTRSICMLPIPTPGRAAHRSRCTCWKTSCALSRQLAAKSAQSCLTCR